MKSFAQVVGLSFLVSGLTSAVVCLVIVPLDDFHLLNVRIEQLNHSLDSLNARLEKLEPALRLRREIYEGSMRHGIDYGLACRLVVAESGWNPGAGSSKGADGLMQVKLATAREVLDRPDLTTEELMRVDVNVDAGLLYLKQCLSEFERVELAVSAYNRGIGAVKASKGKITNKGYVETVLAGYKRDW